MKPLPGRCQVCGCAAVRFKIASNGWVNGHFYVDGKLEKVRCQSHMPPETKPGSAGDWPVIDQKWTYEKG